MPEHHHTSLLSAVPVDTGDVVGKNKMSNISFLTALFTASLEVSTFRYLAQTNYQQRDIRLFVQQNSHQLGIVAHHIHLCFQAKMSGESQLAPHPRFWAQTVSLTY